MAVRVEPRQQIAPLGAEATRILRHLDYALLAAVAGLIAYGLWVLSAVSRNDVPGDPDYFVFRQSVNIAIGVIVLAVVALLDPEIYRRIRVPLYAVSLVALAAIFVADPVRGTRRWIDIGFFRFQPSELGKIVLILMLAGFVADRARRIDEWSTTFGCGRPRGGAGRARLPRAGLRDGDGLRGHRRRRPLHRRHALAPHRRARRRHGAHADVDALDPPGGRREILRPYQVERLIGFWNPDSDPSGATYNITQSITAVGSGGLDGRGVAGATQTNMNYLPEHSTDFIFSSLAEQRGFLGAALLLLLYAIVVWRGVRTIAIAPSLYTAALAAGCVVAFIFQVFVNIGMTVGMAPITGIPLPFVSYGGSSMIATLAMIGLLQAVNVRGRLAAER